MLAAGHDAAKELGVDGLLRNVKNKISQQENFFSNKKNNLYLLVFRQVFVYFRIFVEIVIVKKCILMGIHFKVSLDYKLTSNF